MPKFRRERTKYHEAPVKPSRLEYDDNCRDNTITCRLDDGVLPVATFKDRELTTIKCSSFGPYGFTAARAGNRLPSRVTDIQGQAFQNKVIHIPNNVRQLLGLLDAGDARSDGNFGKFENCAADFQPPDISGLSRGQRQRLLKKERWKRKNAFVECAKKLKANADTVDECGAALGCMEAVEKALNEAVTCPIPHVEKKPIGRRISKKSRAAALMRETKHFEKVLKLTKQHNDPISLLEQHLKNTIKRQNTADPTSARA